MNIKINYEYLERCKLRWKLATFSEKLNKERVNHLSDILSCFIFIEEYRKELDDTIAIPVGSYLGKQIKEYDKRSPESIWTPTEKDDTNYYITVYELGGFFTWLEKTDNWFDYMADGATNILRRSL